MQINLEKSILLYEEKHNAEKSKFVAKKKKDFCRVEPRVDMILYEHFSVERSYTISEV